MKKTIITVALAFISCVTFANNSYETTPENLSSEVFMLERLDKIADELERRMKKSNTKGKTVTLKIKYSDSSAAI